jgi:hypothetical protein
MNKRLALCALLLVVVGTVLSAETVFLSRRIQVTAKTGYSGWHYLQITNVYTKKDLGVLTVGKVIEDIYDVYTVAHNNPNNSRDTRLGTATLYKDTSRRAFNDEFVSLVYNRVKAVAQEDEPQVWLENIDRITSMFVQYVADNHRD